MCKVKIVNSILYQDNYYISLSFEFLTPTMDVETDILERLSGLSSLIGNTPLLQINLKYKGDLRCIYAKAENLNMTGSIKDRMAFHIMKKAYECGKLKAGELSLIHI